MKNEQIVKGFLTDTIRTKARIATIRNSVGTLSVRESEGILYLYSYDTVIGFSTKDAVYMIKADYTKFSSTSQKHIDLLLNLAREYAPNALVAPLQIKQGYLPTKEVMVQKYEAQMSYLTRGDNLSLETYRVDFSDVYNSYKKYMEQNEVTSKYTDIFDTMYKNIQDTKYVEELQKKAEERRMHNASLVAEGFSMAERNY